MIVCILHTKGQIISKGNLVSSISSKKRTKTRRLVVNTNSFVHFLEEFTTWQFAFEINWALAEMLATEQNKNPNFGFFGKKLTRQLWTFFRPFCVCVWISNLISQRFGFHYFLHWDSRWALGLRLWSGRLGSRPTIYTQHWSRHFS